MWIKDVSTHTHSNKTALDRLGVNNSNQVTVDGNPITTNATDRLSGLRWGCLGDSLTDSSWTAAKAYWEHIQERTGIVGLDYGEFGSQISNTYPSIESLLQRYPSMPNDCDIVTVFGGTNDNARGVALGALGSTSNMEFYGATELLFRGLRTKYPTQPIGVIIPVWGRGMGNYGTALKEVAKKYSFPILDLYADGNLPFYVPADPWNSMYWQDEYHPTDAGQKLWSYAIESFIRKLVGV